MKPIKLLLMAVVTILSVTVYAQESANKNKDLKQETEKAKYSCPMHPDVTSNKPGKCSKCGMALTLSAKEKMKHDAKKQYCCPMHPDVKGGKHDKCSKCGMELKEKKEDHSDHKH